MGRLDQYAKEIFATETAPVTGGAAVWQPPSELNLSEVRLDGRLLIRDPSLLAALAYPWPAAASYDEIVFEAKMQGEHLTLHASERACLRRQARQVQRMEEDPKNPWEGDLPLIRLGLLNMLPEFRAGRVAEARSTLRRVLARRKLPLGATEQARIDACTDPATLERWTEQAVDAPTAAEALL